MELNLFLFAFLGLYIGQVLFSIWADSLNMSYSLRGSGSVPAGFEAFIDREKSEQAVAYTREKGRLGIFEEVVSNGVLLAILLSGLLPALAGGLESLGASSISAAMIFFFVPGVIQFAAELPFDYQATFGIEQRFGFNRTGLKLWIIDHLKSGIIGMALFGVLLSILMLLIRDFPAYWWLWGFAIVSAVQVLLAVIFPVVIAPLFNKFEPVKDDELAGKIMRLMEENGIRVKKILQMDAGTRSRHTNAYFTGIGRTKQIVLYDTLIQSHTHDEILSVLAHEAGHFRRRHVLKQLAIFSCFSLAAFYLTWLFIQWPTLYATFGFGAPVPYAGLFLAGIVWQKLGFFLQPFYMCISRRFEKEADTFAVKMMGTATPMISAMRRLASDNLSNLSPHPLFVWFHYSHPPITMRVEQLEEAERNLEGGGSVFGKRAASR